MSRQFYHPPSPYNLEQRCHHKKIKLVILHDPLADWADKRTNLDDLVSKHGWSTTESSKFVTDHKTKLLRMRRATLTKLRSKIRTVALGLLDKHVPGRDLSKHTELAQVLTSAIGQHHALSICVEAMKEIAGYMEARESDVTHELLCFMMQEVLVCLLCENKDTDVKILI